MNENWNKELVLCKAYFESAPVLMKLLAGFKEKYASFGRFGGKVVLVGLKTDEAEVLEGFLQKNLHGQKSVTVSAEKFAAALQTSRFYRISPEELLRECFRDDLRSNKDILEEKDRQRARFFQELIDEFSADTTTHTNGNDYSVDGNMIVHGTVSCKERTVPVFDTTPAKALDVPPDAVRWLSEVLNQKDGTWKMLARKYEADPDNLRVILSSVMHGIEQLPYRKNQQEYLAVFAAKITGNPHAFDEGTDGGSLFKSVLKFLFGACLFKPIFPAIQVQKLYLQAGILKDDLSNYTVVSGLTGYRKDGVQHEGLQGFHHELDTLQISLAVIHKLGLVSADGNRIYVVENPSVYSVLQNAIRGRYACMCMNGQPVAASIILLEKLAQGNTKIYYAGDFDPEGLWIAQRLKTYFGPHFLLWRMDVENYQKARFSKEISDQRLKGLEKLQDTGLLAVAEEMKMSRRAAYQEGLLKEYLQDIG